MNHIVNQNNNLVISNQLKFNIKLKSIKKYQIKANNTHVLNSSNGYILLTFSLQ